MSDSTTLTCPHCGATLNKITLPWEQSTWGEEFAYVCFNDECSLYTKGWKRMRELYDKNISYRYMMFDQSRKSISQPVWDSIALRDRIVDESA